MRIELSFYFFSICVIGLLHGCLIYTYYSVDKQSRPKRKPFLWIGIVGICIGFYMLVYGMTLDVGVLTYEVIEKENFVLEEISVDKITFSSEDNKNYTVLNLNDKNLDISYYASDIDYYVEQDLVWYEYANWFGLVKLGTYKVKYNVYIPLDLKQVLNNDYIFYSRIEEM